MHAGRLVFAQLMQYVPWKRFGRLVAKYGGERYVKSFSCVNQFLCMAFAQLAHRESLRDIEACLRSQSSKLYHLGLRGRVSRSTLAEANEQRDWRIYAELAQGLINTARPLYAHEPLAVDLDNTVYALDATLINLCVSLFPWARYATGQAAVKVHTLLDLRGNIPSFVRITSSQVYDTAILDLLIPEPGAFYVLDRGFTDFARLHRLHRAGAFFVIRARWNLAAQRRHSQPIDRGSGLRSDQTVVLGNPHSRRIYPETLRRVRIKDPASGRALVFLTNEFALPALTICELYRMRWQVELFFKWIKQHLRIKGFFGTSENAVKTQIWIALAVYVLIAILKKRLHLKASLHELLQILSISLFETAPIDQLLSPQPLLPNTGASSNQLTLFDF
jgi:Domain of unknown function (DUF4372)/Transposase DDE domain